MAGVISASAQTPACIWAKSATGGNFDYSRSICTDDNGNVFIAGEFRSYSLTFDTTVLYTYGNSYYSVFLTKYDANGNELWARSASGLGSGSNGAWSVCTDHTGNVYIAGWADSDTVVFGSDTVSCSGGNIDLFIAKYDPDGNVLWAKSTGAHSYGLGGKLCVDSQNNAILTGSFNGPYLCFNSDTVFNIGSGYDLFLVKYDPSGNVLWARGAQGDFNDVGKNVCVDTKDFIYLVGTFNGHSIVFDGDTLFNSNPVNNTAEAFLTKFDKNGNAVWARSGRAPCSTDYGSGVCTDADDNVFITGSFQSVPIAFGDDTLQSMGSFDPFIVKYNTSGDVLWARSGGGTDQDYGNDVFCDSYGNVWLTGGFTSATATFGSFNVVNTNQVYDLFLVKYDNNGNELYAGRLGRNDYDQCFDITLDYNDNVYITGVFGSQYLFFANDTLSNSGEYDIFVAKLGTDVGINDLLVSNSFSLFPNPASSSITITAPQKSEIEIFNIEAQSMIQTHAPDYTTTLDISRFAPGMYFAKVKSSQGIAVKKFLKQ